MTQKPDIWMPLHVTKYLGDTMRLTRDQHGAYLLLLMAYWMTGEALPDNDCQLAATCKATTAEWRRLRPALEPFFQIADGKWRQKRAEEELSKARNYMKAKSEAGKEGAKRRWQKHSYAHSTDFVMPIAEPCQQHRQSDGPVPTPEHSKVLNFARGHVPKQTAVTAENNLALFQKWLAVLIGAQGWRIVGEAADPESENYEEALAFCKERAKLGGKGWPHNWPERKVAL